MLVLCLCTVYCVVDRMGYLEHIYYGIDEAEKYLENADYVIGGGVTYNLSSYEEIKGKLEKIDGVKSVIYKIYGNAAINTDKTCKGEDRKVKVFMYSEGYFDYYKEKLASGAYPSESIIDGRYQCITNLRDLKTGDSLYIFPVFSDEGKETEPLGEIEITGKLYYGGKFLNTTRTSNGLSLSECYEYDEAVIIIPYSKEYLENVKNYMYAITGNFYVIYDDDISDEQKQSIREQALGEYFYLPMSEAIERSVEEKKNQSKTQMLLPILCIYLCAMTFIVISVVSAYRYMNEFSVYYIVGGTKRKIIGIINLSLVPIIIIAIIFGIILINNYDKIKAFEVDMTLQMGYVMYNSFNIYIIGFLMVLILISNIIVAAVISRMSPAKLYRQLNS